MDLLVHVHPIVLSLVKHRHIVWDLRATSVIFAIALWKVRMGSKYNDELIRE